MKDRRNYAGFALMLLVFACGACDGGRVPDAPARLLLHAATDARAFAAAIADFEQLSGIQIEHVQMSSHELYEYARGSTTARRPDLLISSAMDLQTKLVNDGYALSHRLMEPWAVPTWARWRDEAFGFTYEPAVLVYNTGLLAEAEVPRTRAELLARLRDPARPLRGQVGTYDVRRSGLGYLLATQDTRLTPLSSALASAMGDNEVLLAEETHTLLQALVAGRLALAYNVLGSYAQARIDAGESLKLVQLEDYTLVVARVALIPKSAPHVAQAHHFLDYLLSERGQRALARGGLPPLPRGSTVSGAGSALRPVPLGPGLLVYRDSRKRQAFLQAWTSAIHPAVEP